MAKTKDKTDWGAIQRDMEAALKPVCEKHGMSVRQAGATIGITGTSATLKFEVAGVGESGEVEGKHADNFRAYARSEGMSPDDLYREFTIFRDRYKIIGFRPRADKPVMAHKVGQKSDRRFFAFPSEAVVEALAKEPGNGSKAVAAVVAKMEGGVKPGKRPDEKILADIRGVENALSPENLYADGERSHAEAKRIKADLDRRMTALRAELGRRPTPEELGYTD